MNQDRELDQISQLFRNESAALRKRTLLLSAIPIVVGAVVVITAYYGVANARAKVAGLEERRTTLEADVDELLAEQRALAEEIEQQRKIADYLQEKLPREEKETASLIQTGLDAYNKGDWQDAVETLESAVGRDSSVAEVHYRLGISLWQTGKGDAALEQMRTAFNLDKSYQERAAENPLLKQLWDYRELVAEGRSAGEPGEVKHIEEALASSRSGSFDKAAESYGKALETNPDNARVHGLKGDALYQQGDDDQAIASYKQCLELDPGSAECHFNLGLALWRQEKSKQALAAFLQAFELDPRLEARAQRNPLYRRIEKEIDSQTTVQRPARLRKPGSG